MSNISELIGKTLKSINVHNSELIRFYTEEGDEYVMWHEQDCCESVDIEDICGSLENLIGSPVLMAEEVISEVKPPDVERKYEPESETWTFYKIATINEYVTIRWFGQSNGYYSEYVSFDKVS